MEALDIRTLTEDGYVIAIRPPRDGEKPETINLTFAKRDGKKMIPAIKELHLVKVYHNRIVGIRIDGGFEEFYFEKIYQGTQSGEVTIESSNGECVWFFSFRPNSCGMVRFEKSDSGDLVDQEAIIFVGQTHGLEDIVTMWHLSRDEEEADSDLRDIIHRFHQHYSTMLNADK